VDQARPNNDTTTAGAAAPDNPALIRRGRWKMLAVLAVCAAPLIAS
jgi:hypothetical protein